LPLGLSPSVWHARSVTLHVLARRSRRRGCTIAWDGGRLGRHSSDQRVSTVCLHLRARQRGGEADTPQRFVRFPLWSVRLPSSTPTLRRRILLAHHFFHPDEVVSARLFADLAVGLSERGRDVTALTSNRSWADPKKLHPPRAQLRGVHIERVHRPAWGQAKPLERLANSAWLLAEWTRRMTMMRAFDVACRL
jgi:hypothetical protein